MFKALLIERAEDGTTAPVLRDLPDDRLPEGDVTVEVAYSTINYKDGLCLSQGGGGLRERRPGGGEHHAGVVALQPGPVGGGAAEGVEELPRQGAGRHRRGQTAAVRDAGLFDPAALGAVLDQHFSGARDHYATVTFALDVALDLLDRLPGVLGQLLGSELNAIARIQQLGDAQLAIENTFALHFGGVSGEHRAD